VAEILATIGAVDVANITAGYGQTRMCWSVVPGGMTGYFVGWFAQAGRHTAAWAEVHPRVRKWAAGGSRTAGVVKRTGLTVTNGPKVEEVLPVAHAYPARTVIWLRAELVSATVAMSGGFNLINLTNIHTG
jgi:hypothetical protein